MQVTFLGTGSAMPTGDRMQTGLLVDADGDAGPLLVDCGSGALHSLAATETGYEGVDTVLLSHHHLDHVADLLPLMKARWLAGAESLRVVGPPGTGELVEGLLDVHDYMQDRLDLRLREVTPDEAPFDLAGFSVDAMETVHSMYCHAYRFRAADGEASDEAPTFTFSGDSEAIDRLARFADGSAVLAHDCSFPDEVDVDNHPTPATLGETLAGHDYGTVYLTHLYPHTVGKEEEMLASLREAYNGEVRFAEDGLTVDVA
ncbi:MBL fold metallo-hydrolase [Halobacteriales archaeon QS_4_70_19]|nr:MAG: MBL fold metallo-hydrolase [Halobacteriales archaeon QS_4_70_19]